MILQCFDKNPKNDFLSEFKPYFKAELNYLLVSSIATATATVILSLRVVTCVDNRRRASLQARLQATRKIAPRALCVTQHSAKHTASSVAQRRSEEGV